MARDPVKAVLDSTHTVEYGLVALAAASAACLVLLLLVGELRRGSVAALDPVLLRVARETFGTEGPFVGLAEDMTAFGNDVTLWAVTLLGAGYLFADHRCGAGLHLLAATGAGGVLTTGLKLLVHRPRPDVVVHLVAVHSASFPSGHAMNSAFVYGTLALVAAARTMQAGARLYLACGCVALVVLIGASRIVLGVHWPSDVLAGWAFGAGWAFLARRLVGINGTGGKDRSVNSRSGRNPTA